MRNKKRLRKRAYVAVMSGAVIVSMAAVSPMAALAVDYAVEAEGEEKLWEDMTEEERMALPEEERERLKAEAEKRAEDVRRWESMTEEERMALPEEEREYLSELAERARRREEEAEAGNKNPGTESGNETPDAPKDPEIKDDTGNQEIPENPDKEDVNKDPEDSETPENPDGEDGNKDPDDSKEPGEEDKNLDKNEENKEESDSKNPDEENKEESGSDSETPDSPDSENSDDDSVNKELPVPEYPSQGAGNMFGSLNPSKEAESDASEETPDSLTDTDDDSENRTDNAAKELLPGKGSNEELIAGQKIVKLPEIVEDSHFWTVARKYAFAKEDMMIREKTPDEDADEGTVRIIGRIKENGLLYILEEKDGWYYVESGKVRGFVKAEDVITGKKASKLLKKYQKKAKKQAKETKSKYKGIEGTAPVAEDLVYSYENEAFTYLRATVNQTVIEKQYALVSEKEAEVKEDKSTDSRTVGTIPSGGLCYILEDKDQDWIYVESDEVRGFVESKDITSGEEVTKAVEKKGEEKYSFAEETIEPEENTAYYYTLTSTKPGLPSGEIRRSMIEYAAQFVGNPYVWGGTSLTKGADCSGFVQSIYKQYGYTLPRVACDQAQYGVKIPVEDALPGDLIFYAKDGYVHHVVMYAGEGKTIEAMSSKAGIVQADVREGDAVWATRILDDNGYTAGSIGEVNAEKDMYGRDLGEFKLTYYCSCELCCDVETGITATGKPVVEGRTIAVDPSVIPYGTQVIIGGHIFTAEDCGGAIKGNKIDIYVNNHQKALELGVNYADVYLKK